MFKLFWSRTTAGRQTDRDWRHDPLGHPALQDMSLRELADLPMVAEVPMRVCRVEMANDCRRGVGQEHPAGSAASR